MIGSVVKLSILFFIAGILNTLLEVSILLIVTGAIRTLSGGAHCSRYAIWAADVREIINVAIKDIDNNEIDSAKGKLILALNAMGAYIDIQSLFDSQPGGMKFDSAQDIIRKYSTFQFNEK